jgi:teichuronic acid biosynthesis glycosyltransferase TuaG
MTFPRVDIIIPTYNQAEFLREALASVFAQTHENWHVIIVDNHSTDHTSAVLAEFSDPRITFERYANEGVIAASRNHAMRISSGEFIAFLDSDDVWRPTKLERSVQALQSGYDLVCHAEEWRSATASRVVQYGPTNRASYYGLLRYGNCLSTSAVVVKRAVVQRQHGFSERPEFVTAEDYDLWLRLARDGCTMCFLPDVLGTFRIHESSASSAVVRNSAAEIAVVSAHIAASPFNTAMFRRRRRSLSQYATARAYYRATDYSSAWKSFRSSVRLWPFFWRTYAGIVLLMLSLVRRRFST